MAIHLTARQRFVPTWEDNDKLPEAEQISCIYRCMNPRDVFDLQKETDVNLLFAQELDLNNIEIMNKYWTMISTVLLKYTEEFKNISVDGKALQTPEEVVKGLRFSHLNLLAEVFQKVLSESMGTPDDAKNSSTVSEPISPETVTPVENV